ncbi:MAG: autotransporter-associated beta strand repeat-containing protein [Akkermansiaceae bacterium]|nr:autotransporter-associated beta strand repeat-containing protein [Akkermansiaceae bacterium]
MSLIKTGAGTQIFDVDAAHTYSGGTTLSAGTLQIGSSSAGTVGAVTSGPLGTGTAVLNGGTLSSSSTNAQTLLNAATIGGNVTLGDAVDNGMLNFSAGVDLGAADRTLTTASSVAFNGAVSGNGGITKAGSATLTLGANNTYLGNTVLSQGSLIINGNQSSATGAFTVASGAMLGGSGTIGGATTISGIHSPGNSAGVQTFASNLTYIGTPTVEWELTANTTTQASPTPVFDQIVVNGNLDFSVATTLTLNFALAGSTVDWSNGLWGSDITGTSGWLVYDVAGSLSDFQNLLISVENWADGQGALLGTVRAGSSFSLYNDGNDIYLTYAIPEPSTYALLSLLGAGIAGRIMVRRRRSHGVD